MPNSDTFRLDDHGIAPDITSDQPTTIPTNGERELGECDRRDCERQREQDPRTARVIGDNGGAARLDRWLK